MTPEGRVKAHLKSRLFGLYGDDCWRFMPVQTGMGSPALDFILCFRGHFITVETKKPTGKLTPLQKSVRADTLRAGGLVFCVYDDETVQDLMEYLQTLEWIHGRPDDPPTVPLQAQDKGERAKHSRPVKQREAADSTARRDHGAPRKKSQRCAQPAACGDDPKLTAPVSGDALHWLRDIDNDIGC